MEKLYLTAQECAELLGVSLGHSYKILRQLNKELANDPHHYITVAGKVPKAYFYQRYFTGEQSEVKGYGYSQLAE